MQYLSPNRKKYVVVFIITLTFSCNNKDVLKDRSCDNNFVVDIKKDRINDEKLRKKSNLNKNESVTSIITLKNNVKTLLEYSKKYSIFNDTAKVKNSLYKIREEIDYINNRLIEINEFVDVVQDSIRNRAERIENKRKRMRN